MTQGTFVSFEGRTWKFSADSYREYSAALSAAEVEVTDRFGQRPGFSSPDAVAAWEYEVVSAAHKKLFKNNRPKYKGAWLPAHCTDAWATVEAFRRGEHSSVDIMESRRLEELVESAILSGFPVDAGECEIILTMVGPMVLK